MGRIYFTFKKSFLREQGITKEDIEKGLAILAKEFRKGFNSSEPRDGSGRWTSSGENIENESEEAIEQEQKEYKENESEEAIQKQRIALVNKAPVIEGEKPLKVPKKNYVNAIEKKAEELNSLLKNNKIVCTCLQKQVKGCNVNHLSNKKGKPRSYENALNHGAYIPFVVPVLENGITDSKMDRPMKHGSVSHEIVCRAKVDEKKIGISVIVVENNDGVSVQMISVFKIDDPKNLIKSHGFNRRGINAIGTPSLP